MPAYSSYNNVSFLALKLFSHTFFRSVKWMVSYFPTDEHPHIHAHMSPFASISMCVPSLVVRWLFSFHFISFNLLLLSIRIPFIFSLHSFAIFSVFFYFCCQTYNDRCCDFLCPFLHVLWCMCRCVGVSVCFCVLHAFSKSHTHTHTHAATATQTTVYFIILCNLCSSRCLSYQIMSLKSNFNHSLQFYLYHFKRFLSLDFSDFLSASSQAFENE